MEELVAYSYRNYNLPIERYDDSILYHEIGLIFLIF